MSKGIKVCAGDFAVGSVGKISYSSGKPCAISFEDRSIRGRFLRDLSESIESIPLHNLVRVEIVAQDNVGKSGNMILRGVVGAALLGPVGAIAGAATTARRQTEIMFRADFKDGRTLLAKADFESFTCLKSAEFATEESGRGKPAAQPTQVEWRRPRTQIPIFLLGPIALVAVLFALFDAGTKPAVPPTPVAKAPIVMSDGCDLAGAIPNCKAVMAELAAKRAKGTEASAGGAVALKL
jgi:hypothetical protein